MQSETIKELAKALAKCQGEVSVAHKSKNNTFHKSKYADLASCWDACRGPLASNGLSIVQFPGKAEKGWINLITQLIHESGQWIKGSINMRLVTRKQGGGWIPADDPQTYGITCTYARRYGLMAMVGIAPGDDTDGEPTNKEKNEQEQLSKIQTTKEKKQLSKPIKPSNQDDIPMDVPPITHDKKIPASQATAFRKEAGRLKLDGKQVKSMIKAQGFNTADDISVEKYDELFNALGFMADEAKEGVE